MRRMIRSVLFGLLVLPLAASGVSATDCAPFISGSLEDGPSGGRLIGTMDVSAELRGSTGVVTGTFSGSWSVGWYLMMDGSTLVIDCRNYTVFKLI